ncbi:MAG: hypothetical protein HW403_1272 [Dehalococcoidia bacterium]|nr:hypothetical protein [Dehalococcoidia bacterium]
MSSGVGLALFTLAVVVVGILLAAPFIRTRFPGPPPRHSPNGRFRELELERDRVFGALREIEFERQLSNLSEEDYSVLRDQYRREAVVLLKAAEVMETEMDAAIEAAVQSLRGRGYIQKPPERDGEKECPGCGAPVLARHRFCPECGVSLPEVSRAAGGSGKREQARARTAAVVVADPPSRRKRVWVLGTGATVAAFVLGVITLFLTTSRSQASQEPVGLVTAQHYHTLAVSPESPEVVFLGHHNGLMKSLDGGGSWQGIPQVSVDVMTISIHPAEAKTIYLTGHDVFVVSLDGGASWKAATTTLPGTDIHAFAIHPDEPRVLYAFVANFGLFRSDDHGATWQLLSQRAPEDTTAITIVPGLAETIYLNTMSKGVQVSVDGGGSWESANGFVNGALPTLRTTALAYDSATGDRFGGASGRSFQGALYVGADRGLFKSTDGGSSWVRLPLNTDVAAMALGPAGSRLILAVDSQGRVYRSRDGGISWKR